MEGKNREVFGKLSDIKVPNWWTVPVEERLTVKIWVTVYRQNVTVKKGKTVYRQKRAVMLRYRRKAPSKFDLPFTAKHLTSTPISYKNYH